MDQMLLETQDVVAGGSMVHAYMGERTAAYSGDVDLFVAEANVPRWRTLLEAAGYGFKPRTPRPRRAELAPDPNIDQRRRVNQQAEEHGYPGIGGIIELFDFQHPLDGRKVQLVSCLNPQEEPSSFDLSAAATWYNGLTLQTEMPHLTHRWYCVWLRADWADCPRWPERQRKYDAKGCTMLDD
ncbi:hypothetical protein ABPG75_007383 [Micractinium tetrahymenae]